MAGFFFAFFMLFHVSLTFFSTGGSLKFNDQFSHVEAADNFDIASLEIDVERFIGRVREWGILNKIWPIQRMDVFNRTWKVRCHIVNLCCEPIGPKP